MSSAEFTEDFFERCAVVEIVGQRVGLVVLHGVNAPEPTQYSKALDALPIPESVPECNDEVIVTQTQLEEGDFPRRYIDASQLVDASLTDLAIGQVVNFHQGHNRDTHRLTQVHITPDQLTMDEIKVEVQRQLEARDEQLRRHVANLRSGRYYQRTKIERLDPSQPFRPFENAEIRHHDSGEPYVFIPDRVVASEKWGPQRIRVVATILTSDDEEYSGWENRFTPSGNEFVKKLHQPFEDEGLDVPLVKFDIYTSSILGGHKKAREEQKLELTINGERYWSQVDPEYLLFADFGPDYSVLHMTDKGFDDYIEVEAQTDGDYQYRDFQVVGEHRPNVLYRTLDSDELISTGNSSAVRILLPLDPAVLGEVEAELPGLF